MSNTRTGQTLYWKELGLIQRMIEDITSSVSFTRSDSDYFASFAMSRLMADDYAVLDAYRGRSTFRTFLTVVLFTLLQEFQSKRAEMAYRGSVESSDSESGAAGRSA